jgi:hypothetical protein
VLALLGMAAWIGGQCAVANMVLDRAEPGCDRYTLLDLLRELLQLGSIRANGTVCGEAIAAATNEGTS